MRATYAKKLLRKSPTLYAALRYAKQYLLPSHQFESSASYWELRYQHNGTSGDGSYGRLARFKAEILNTFFVAEGVDSVLELGCGDGAQLSLLNCKRYIGVDVSESILRRTRKKFAADDTKDFLTYTAFNAQSALSADAVLSLDVIYHLVEDDVFAEYMRLLFRSATQWVVIYSSNKDEQTPSPHVRHREFVRWISENLDDSWELHKKIDQRYPESPLEPAESSFADFYFFRSRNNGCP